MKAHLVELPDNQVYVVNIPEDATDGEILAHDKIILHLLERLGEYPVKKKEKLEIISCGDSMMWYNDHIGETFDLIREDMRYFWCIEPAGFINVVEKKDAKLI